MDNNTSSFTDLEIDTFQELMNIVFGNAAADLSEVIDIYVVLSVPQLKMIKAAELPEFIQNNIKEDIVYNTIIEQNFLGNFNGFALVVFPRDNESKFITLFRENKDMFYECDATGELEKEILMEVGNILIGACVGKMAELLNDSVIYEPPRIIVEDIQDSGVYQKLHDPKNWALVLKSTFHFEAQDLTCFLFLVTNNESIGWLKKALNDYLRQFE